MIDDRLLSNLAAYSAQVASIVALATALYYALRIDVPRLRYIYWQTLLILCLALPLLQAWPSPPPAAAVDGLGPAAAAPVVLTVSIATGRVSSNEPADWTGLSVRVIAAGIALRLFWTAVGLWGLRGLRRAGEPAGFSEYADVKGTVGVAAEIRYVRGIHQPVTFGLRRPVVILPEALREHPIDVQRAVVCHELCHVKRRDWAWLLLEEGVRAALWFHPAVWWVISRIQLTREEAVDAAVIATTGQRRVYAEALMAFADATPLTPAAAFSRRRHLVTRVLLISKEAVMSSKRIVVSCAVMAVAIAAGGWYAVQAFPLQGAAVPTAPRPGQVVGAPAAVDAPGPLERAAKPITPENPIPRRTYSVPVPRPAGAAPFNGAFTLRVTLDRSGRVGEARPSASGLPAVAMPYVQAAVAAVKQWQYDAPADGPITFSVSIGVPASGDLMATQDNGGREVMRFVSAPGGRSGRAGAGAVPGPVEPPPPGQPIRVGGAVLAPTKTRHVNPEYPAIAKSARVQGVVILETVIGPDGTVVDARVLRSIPLLDQAAIDAVRQWEFTPTLLNGQPVPIVMTMTVQFSLPEEAPQPQALLRKGLISTPWRVHRVLSMFFPAASAAVDRERQ